MASDELNTRQAAFCREYLVDFNGAQAYLRAGYTPQAKFGENNGAHRLLALPKIKAELARLSQEQIQAAKISVAEVLEEYRRAAFANITDVVEVVDGHVRIRDTADLPPEVLSAVAEVRETQHGLTVKMHDKVRALDSIGKYLGMFVDQAIIHHEGPPPVLVFESITADVPPDDPPQAMIDVDSRVRTPDGADDPI